MPSNLSLENSFIGGLKTEFTGLNFPENACTECDNCVFSIIGDVLRREGINFEENYTPQTINVMGTAVSSFRWKNAGGDGTTELLVVQAGAALNFFVSSNADANSGVSSNPLARGVNLLSFQAVNNTSNVGNSECQYAVGNGYLIVSHPDCEPFYCTFANSVVTATAITLNIRDFVGISEPSLQGPHVTSRPATLSAEHNYNLGNQGWTSGPSWTTPYSSPTGNFWTGTPPVSCTFQVNAGIVGVTNGETVAITYNTVQSLRGTAGPFIAYGIVSGYTGTTLSVTVNEAGGIGNPSYWGPLEYTVPLGIASVNTSLIGTWNSQVGNYPANSDIWWEYKDTSDVFNPGTTAANITQGAAQAPQGHYIFPAFTQDRTAVSSISGLTVVETTARPKTIAWFASRIWYSGVDASQPASGDAIFTTWTENIYFSQIITNNTQFGLCYQVNDPSDENLFNILPNDGGVIVIPGSGSIHKLFPVQNGIIVFAANGIWFITGSSGIGFSATDYTVTKISAVKSISGTSYIDVLGLPMFWNEEGIYQVTTGKEGTPFTFGGLVVEPLTVGTILSFYNSIPLDSKKYARGDYDPISYVLSWVYRSTEESGISNRYHYDSSLNLNIYNKAFYPYSITSNSNCFVCGLVYMDYPSSGLDPQFKYLTGVNATFTLSEENDDTHWVDFFTYDNTGVDYTSSFTTGYKLHGKGFTKFQPIYVNMYSRADTSTQYLIRGIWDYAINTSSNKYSTNQLITNALGNFGMTWRRHKIRGHGRVLQIQVTSVSGQPFDIMGWTIPETIDGGQ